MKTKPRIPSRPSPSAEPARFTVSLRSVGNPDFRQYSPVSLPRTVTVDSLEAARQACMDYISEWELGGGNWPATFIFRDSRKIADVSYNGRLWSPKGYPHPYDPAA